MENDKQNNDRYFTNQEEFQILKDSIKKYLSLPKRSQDRKNFITQVTKQLDKIHPGRWNDKLVRVWFTNNKDRDFSNDGETAKSDESAENNIQGAPQYSESPQAKAQQLPSYADQKHMRQAHITKPPPQIQQYEPQAIQQSQYEQPPIQQPQYEQQPIQQPQYEQPPIQQPQYEQQPIQQSQYEQVPMQQPQYEQHHPIQQSQYDQRQPIQQTQYEQPPPIQQSQYEQQSIQQQYEQQPIQQSQYEQPIQQTQYEQQQPIPRTQYEQQQPIYQYDHQYQQPPMQQQYQQQSQYQQQPIQQYQEAAAEVPNREMSFNPNFYTSAEGSRLNSSLPYSPFNSSVQYGDGFFQSEPFQISQFESSTSNQPIASIPDANQTNNVNYEAQKIRANESDSESDDVNAIENDDELPSVLKVDSVITDKDQIEQIKNSLYSNQLKDCYRYIKKLRNITNPKVRLAKQEAIEKVFVDNLRIFTEKLNVTSIFSKDISIPFTRSKNALTVSVSTRRYNNEPVDDTSGNASSLVEGNPYIYYSKAFVPPPLLPSLKSFYFGKYDEGGRTSTPIYNIEAATFNPDDGDTICAVFNPELKLHQIILGQYDTNIPTGFFQKATSILAHNNSIYVQGDVRVRVFSLSLLECVDTLYIRKDPIKKSAIAVWNQNIAVGVDNIIYLYSEALPDKTNKEDANFKKEYEEKAVENGTDPNSVDWTRGRNHKRIIKVDRIEKITSMITVGDNLVVASEDYPVIYVYKSDETIIARLVGHTMGITSLHSPDRISLYSGSRDKTIKKWDMEYFSANHSFLMHDDDVTSITTATYKDHLFLFTGSKDSRIYVWDVTAKKSTFQISVTDQCYPLAMLFTPINITLFIIAVTKKSNDDDDQGNEDQIQTFTFSKE